MVSSEEVAVRTAAGMGATSLTPRTVKGVCLTELAAAEEAGVVEGVGTVATVRSARAGVSLIATVLPEGK